MNEDGTTAGDDMGGEMMDDDWEDEEWNEEHDGHKHMTGEEYFSDWDTSKRDEEELMWIVEATPGMGQGVASLVVWATFIRTLLGVVLYPDYTEDRNDKAELAMTTTQDTDPTNYFKLTGMIRTYTGLAVSGAASITQIMSNLGIGGGLNMMVWGWGGMISYISHFISSFILLWGYNTTYGEMTDSANSAAQQVTQLELLESYEQTFWNWATEDAMIATGLVLGGSDNDWAVAQWLLLTPEE